MQVYKVFTSSDVCYIYSGREAANAERKKWQQLGLTKVMIRKV